MSDNSSEDGCFTSGAKPFVKALPSPLYLTGGHKNSRNLPTTIYKYWLINKFLKFETCDLEQKRSHIWEECHGCGL